MNKSDMLYADEYSWTAVDGDDPNKIYDDAKMFNRHEGYEVLSLINSLKGEGQSILSLETKKIIEWMIHDHLPSDIRSRENVKKWLCDNFRALRPSYPY